jgi:hypothetical protein
MGQQQLLLVILVVIVIGVTVAIAIQLFDVNSEDSNKERIITELTNLAIISLQYYYKPATMTGGGRSFTNWQIPAKLDTSTSGTYTITQANNNQLILNGNPIQGSGYTWYVKATITSGGIVTEIVDNLLHNLKYDF